MMTFFFGLGMFYILTTVVQWQMEYLLMLLERRSWTVGFATGIECGAKYHDRANIA